MDVYISLTGIPIQAWYKSNHSDPCLLFVPKGFSNRGRVRGGDGASGSPDREQDEYQGKDQQACQFEGLVQEAQMDVEMMRHEIRGIRGRGNEVDTWELGDAHEQEGAGSKGHVEEGFGGVQLPASEDIHRHSQIGAKFRQLPPRDEAMVNENELEWKRDTDAETEDWRDWRWETKKQHKFSRNNDDSLAVGMADEPKKGRGTKSPESIYGLRVFFVYVKPGSSCRVVHFICSDVPV